MIPPLLGTDFHLLDATNLQAGRTALLWVAANWQKKAEELLLEHGVNSEHEDAFGTHTTLSSC